jgi:hypothetical protein
MVKQENTPPVSYNILMDGNSSNVPYPTVGSPITNTAKAAIKGLNFTRFLSFGV